MFALIVALALSEPQPPKAIPWPGGVWQLDGKTYPAGSFLWIKRADQDRYDRDHAAWEKAHPGKVLAKRTAFGWDFCGLAPGLTGLDWTYRDGKITGTAPLAAYGGTGSFSAEYTVLGRKLEVVLNRVDVAKFLKGIGLRAPIEVTGTCGTLSGTIDGDKGYFVGKDMRTSPAVRSVDLTVDFRTGAYTSTADTSFGKQSFRGVLNKAK